MKYMEMITNKEDPKVPVGKAALIIGDSGWVGTNVGCPFHGQPALFPEAQASAIMYAWNNFAIVNLRRPEDVPSDVLEWLS